LKALRVSFAAQECTALSKEPPNVWFVHMGHSIQLQLPLNALTVAQDCMLKIQAVQYVSAVLKDFTVQIKQHPGA